MDKQKIYKYAHFLLQQGNGSAALAKAIKNVTLPNEIDKGLVSQMEGIGVIQPDSKIWNEGLNRVASPPQILFYKGNANVLRKKRLVIVGTRSISDYARNIIKQLLLPGVWSRNVVVTSGLAYGVDAMAHRVALRNGISTCAIVAAGLDKGYPRGNQTLYDAIVKEGCVLAEYPPGKPVVKGMFPMRNRLMAGLADIVLVVEGGKDSGSLITVNLALELGLDVYAVPADIDRKVAQGSNELIKNGAGVITTQRDLIDALGIQPEKNFEDKSEKIVYDLVREYQNILPEVVASKVNLDLRETIDILTKLQIEGILWRNGTGEFHVK